MLFLHIISSIICKAAEEDQAMYGHLFDEDQTEPETRDDSIADDNVLLDSEEEDDADEEIDELSMFGQVCMVCCTSVVVATVGTSQYIACMLGRSSQSSARLVI